MKDVYRATGLPVVNYRYYIEASGEALKKKSWQILKRI